MARAPSSRPRPAARWREAPAAVRPMLATLADAPLRDARLVYEPKYDGIRALVALQPRAGGLPVVRMWSRLGNEKTLQFPELAGELQKAGRALRMPLLVDGEIVALDENGEPTGFQQLQGRIHLTPPNARPPGAGVAFIAFDLLRDGDEDLRPRPLAERRARLERRLRPRGSALRLSDVASGDGTGLAKRALKEGWEGLIAKDASAPYVSGRRSPSWRKLKIVRRQEFVIGGWTEPRQTRQHFGALLLGVYERRAPGAGNDERTEHREPSTNNLVYVGHTGTGFDHAELTRVSRLLAGREVQECPFAARPRTNQRPHWVRPDLVAEVKFTEWTSDGYLRHPVYLGLRDDIRPETVRREPGAGRFSVAAASGSADTGSDEGAPKTRTAEVSANAPRPQKRETRDRKHSALIDQLQSLEDAGRDGILDLPAQGRLKVTNLRKLFWPKLGITKGELLRFYVQVSPLVLPAVADRPLVMRRFPNGVEGKAFYQQRVRETPPPGVRVETLPRGIDPIGEPGTRRLVGGDLMTLLYMTQMAAISQDPWFSRVQTPLDADYVALDLDPVEGASFARVLEVARRVRDELESLGVPGVPKTSGKSGLHVYIPLPKGTPYDLGQLFCRVVATKVAAKYPKVATVERMVKRRPKGSVYVDYLQNILGKTLATAYSVRNSSFAGVSTPLTWEEVDGTPDPRDFTLRTTIDRFRRKGDLWARLRRGRPANLEAAIRKLR
jgi:bifunctional non-homologous end joining protein LigD